METNDILGTSVKKFFLILKRLGQTHDIDLGTADGVREISVRHVDHIGRGGGRDPHRYGGSEFRQRDRAFYPGADRKIGDCSIRRANLA